MRDIALGAAAAADRGRPGPGLAAGPHAGLCTGPCAGRGAVPPGRGTLDRHARARLRRAGRPSRAPDGSRTAVARWLAGAAAAAAVVVGGVVWHPWDTGTPRTPVSASQQVLRAGDARSYTDRSTTIVRSASLGKAVVRGTLPPPPAGKVYELWLQQPDGTMARAGLVSDAAGIRAGVVLQGDAATATGAGITLEPAGGSDAPTTTPLALVSFT